MSLISWENEDGLTVLNRSHQDVEAMMLWVLLKPFVSPQVRSVDSTLLEIETTHGRGISRFTTGRQPFDGHGRRRDLVM